MNYDKFINIIGILGSSLVGICFIPQTYKTIYSNEIKDISLSFLLLNIFAAGLMCVYGGYYIIIPVIIANGSVLINCGIIYYCVCVKKTQLESSFDL
jgi:uncharacterized protein with PQ loop repeat